MGENFLPDFLSKYSAVKHIIERDHRKFYINETPNLASLTKSSHVISASLTIGESYGDRELQFQLRHMFNND